MKPCLHKLSREDTETGSILTRKSRWRVVPVGLQIIGKPFDEATVLRATRSYEQTTSWNGAASPIVNQPAPKEAPRR